MTTDLRGIPSTNRRENVERGHWDRRGVAMVLFAALVATLPFLNKAFHIDDVLYLRVADQIRRSPGNPYDGMVLWDAPDGQPGKLFETDFNPPLWKYILAATISLAGREEWNLHAVEAAFIALAGLGVYRVSQRFSDSPAWCTVLILWAPFFLPGTNIMLEGPLLCFCVWAIEFGFRSWTEDRLIAAWTTGVLLAAAVLTKYTAGLLLPWVFFGSLLARRPRALVALIPPAVALGGWILHNKLTYGHSHFGAHGFQFGGDETLTRLRAVILCIGAVTPFGPLLIGTCWKNGRAGKIALVACLIGAGSFAWAELGWLKSGINYGAGWSPTALQTWHYAAFAFHGSLILLTLTALAVLDWTGIPRSRRLSMSHGGSRTLLEMLVAAYLAFNVFCVPFNAVRHLLLALVPMTWLVTDRLRGSFDLPSLRKLTLVVSAALGFGLAAADYEIADCYRKAARDIVGRWAQGGNTVWFAGNWGFVHYANLAGGYPLVQFPAAYGLPDPKEGDIIVHPRLLTWKYLPLPSDLAAVTALEHHNPATNNPLRTIAPSVHFYSQVGETLPWEFLVFPPDSDEKRAWFQLPPLDDILVYRIERRK